MKILTVAFIVFSAFYTKCFCTDNMKFSDDDLKKFSLSTRPQKTRDIERINQKTDVIYFKKDTKSPHGMEKYIKYNEPSHAIFVTKSLNSEMVIKEIELLQRNNKTINVINAVDNYMIDDRILDYLKNNVQSLSFLNVKNTRITENAIREFKIKKPNVKVIY